MTNKLPTLAGYMTIGAVLIWLLAANLLKRDVGQERKAPVPLPLIVFSIEALVFLSFAKPRLGVGSIGVVLLSAVACYASAGQSRWKSDWPVLASLVVTLLFATTLAWWRRTGPELDASYGAFIALHVLLAISFWILARAPEEGRRSDRIEPLAVIVFIGFGAFVVFSTGLYDNPWMYGLAWHHWGAYVGPAQLVSAGARILHDIPAQYGFGPTMLLALSCKEDCWLAMYWWVAVLSLTYGALILWTARKASAGQQAPLQIVLIAFAVFATVYLWTAYPPNVGSPAVTPSVSGLRFLPLALLIAVITQRDDRRSTKPPSEYIHLIWLAGVLWSPESAAQVTVVWWPYYVWRCARSGRNVLHANVRLACWLIATFVAFILIYRIAYGVFPSLTTYLAYVMYPPGPLPINPWGAIWFFGLAGLAGIVSVRRQLRRAPDDHRTQNLVVFALASFGAASYYLGRSHDNNLLNVSVFFLLLLLAVREISDSRLARFVSCAAIAALISYPVLFGWNSWTSLAQSGRLFEFRPRATVSNFTYTSPRGQQANTAGSSLAATASDDADRGMRTIVKQFDEPVTVLDAAINLDASNAGVPWSACHGPENFVYLPSALRRQFLASTADRLTRPGWLLISANYDAASFLSDYDAVYRRDRRLDFGTYYAIRYVPLADRPR